MGNGNNFEMKTLHLRQQKFHLSEFFFRTSDQKMNSFCLTDSYTVFQEARLILRYFMTLNEKIMYD